MKSFISRILGETAAPVEEPITRPKPGIAPKRDVPEVKPKPKHPNPFRHPAPGPMPAPKSLKKGRHER